MLDGNLPSNDLINSSSYSYCRAITSETGRRTSVRLWPIAEVSDFPKADTRAAGFEKSRRTIPAASFGCEVDILGGKFWP